MFTWCVFLVQEDNQYEFRSGNTPLSHNYEVSCNCIDTIASLRVKCVSIAESNKNPKPLLPAGCHYTQRFHEL